MEVLSIMLTELFRIGMRILYITYDGQRSDFLNARVFEFAQKLGLTEKARFYNSTKEYMQIRYEVPKSVEREITRHDALGG